MYVYHDHHANLIHIIRDLFGATNKSVVAEKEASSVDGQLEINKSVGRDGGKYETLKSGTF